MTQDPMTSKKENTAPAQPSVPAAKEKESAKELLPLSPEHEALVSGMYDRLVKTVRTTTVPSSVCAGQRLKACRAWGRTGT